MLVNASDREWRGRLPSRLIRVHKTLRPARFDLGCLLQVRSCFFRLGFRRVDVCFACGEASQHLICLDTAG
jgi:hypothetical protein